MLIYIPERVYKKVSNSSELNSIYNENKNYILSDSLITSYQNSISVLGTDMYIRYFSTLKRMLEHSNLGNLIKEIGYLESSAVELVDDDEDIENKLVVISNKISLSKENELEYYSLIDEYLNTFYLNTSFDFSEQVYSNVYYYSMKKYLNNLYRGNINFKEVIDDFILQDQTYFNFLTRFFCNHDYLYNMLSYNRMILYTNLFKLLKKSSNRNLEPNFNYAYYLTKKFTNKFKYFFNYPNLIFLHELFLYYFEVRDFTNALKTLDSIINYINYAFINTDGNSFKSLSYHNNILTPNFLILVIFYHNFITNYLTEYDKQINISNYLDQKFIKGDIQSEYFSVELKDLYTKSLNDCNIFLEYNLETFKFFNLFIKARKGGNLVE